uniref:MFS domain-containing protein n=1 Tax=Angiostrongylus cantonensis TaxID=6313 RepID=A0A0K0DDM7_ANGCA
MEKDTAVSNDSSNPTTTYEHSRLLKRDRPHLLRLPSSIYLPEPSPCTPCSVFSFELPSTPIVIRSRSRLTRSSSRSGGLTTTATPHSVFSFDVAFDLTSPKTPRTPRTPISPRTPKTPRFPELPTIEESRDSFSFAVQSSKDDEIPCDESVTPFDKLPSQTDWKSIRLMSIVVLLTRIQFTVYFASLWPFLQEIDESATMHDYALINALYSVGIAGSAPFFGYWSNKLGNIRVPSIYSMVLMFTTNSLYIAMHNFTGHGKYVMGVARFLSGIAAGGNSLLPTYWTYAATAKDRSTAAALFDGAFCLGIALGPGKRRLVQDLRVWSTSLNLQ